MLTTEPITKKSQNFTLFMELYKEAFPPRERKPVRLLFACPKLGRVQFNAYYDEAVFVGFSQTITFGDLSYVAYLAVAAGGRSKGYGGQILSLIRKSHSDCRIFLCLETEDDTAKNATQRTRRRSFYLKNGCQPIGLNMSIAGNIVELMAVSGMCTQDEIKGLFRKHLGWLLSKILRIKFWKNGAV